MSKITLLEVDKKINKLLAKKIALQHIKKEYSNKFDIPIFKEVVVQFVDNLNHALDDHINDLNLLKGSLE